MCRMKTEQIRCYVVYFNKVCKDAKFSAVQSIDKSTQLQKNPIYFTAKIIKH